jgi:hypothetical protein
MQMGENSKRTELCKIETELNNISRSEQKRQEDLTKLKSLQLSKAVREQQHTIITEELNRYALRREELLQRKNDLLSGKLDSEMKKADELLMKKATQKSTHKNRDELDIIPVASVSFRNEDRNIEKIMDKEFSYYNEVNSTLPRFISEKLDDMPNNRGYIWRGVWYFGQQPSRNDQPLVMFEKYQKVLYVHEYSRDQPSFAGYDSAPGPNQTVTEHKMYERNGKDQKLISCTKKIKDF